VNPGHLREASHAQNSQDKVTDGTSGRGKYLYRLTKEQVIAILADERPYPQIAASYDVITETIAKIKRGKTWRQLTGSGSGTSDS
jgi:hypothetical protein